MNWMQEVGLAHTDVTRKSRYVDATDDRAVGGGGGRGAGGRRLRRQPPGQSRPRRGGKMRKQKSIFVKFANRLLGMKCDRQMRVFSFFHELYQDEIRYAKSEGRYNPGVVSIPTSMPDGIVEKAEFNSPLLLRTDPHTGAKTNVISLQVDHGMGYEQATLRLSKSRVTLLRSRSAAKAAAAAKAAKAAAARIVAANAAAAAGALPPSDDDEDGGGMFEGEDDDDGGGFIVPDDEGGEKWSAANKALYIASDAKPFGAFNGFYRWTPRNIPQCKPEYMLLVEKRSSSGGGPSYDDGMKSNAMVAMDRLKARKVTMFLPHCSERDHWNVISEKKKGNPRLNMWHIVRSTRLTRVDCADRHERFSNGLLVGVLTQRRRAATGAGAGAARAAPPPLRFDPRLYGADSPLQHVARFLPRDKRFTHRDHPDLTGRTATAALRLLWQRQYRRAETCCTQCAKCRGLGDPGSCTDSKTRRWSQYDLLSGAVLSIWDKLTNVCLDAKTPLEELRVLRASYLNTHNVKVIAVGIELRGGKDREISGSKKAKKVDITERVVEELADEKAARAEVAQMKLHRERRELQERRAKRRRLQMQQGGGRGGNAAAEIIDLVSDGEEEEEEG
jgi:hypothetical protein